MTRHWVLRRLALMTGIALGALSAAAANAADDAAGAGNLAALKAKYQRPKEVPFPKDNPYSVEKYTLGQTLFFDPRLSAQQTTSCGTCHNPSFAWGDGMATGTGHGAKKLGRRSPTILNLAWGEPFMWDGRAPSLEAQALGPIQADAEMNMPMPTLLGALKSIPGYQSMFETSFPGQDGITPENIGKAIATYERTVVSAKAPFDRWIEGDESAINESAKRGFVTFNTKARCSACHSSWRFTDDSFHDIGLRSADIGRGKFENDNPLMQHAFKTPTLRNVSLRSPYMHDGSVATLDAVVAHYDGGFVQRPSLSPEMQRLNLTEQERKDLVAFMLALTSQDAPVSLPILPPKPVSTPVQLSKEIR